MRVLVFGDSIAQGFWSVEGGWVEKLRKYYDGLALKNLRINKQPEIFNLGVSGDTSQDLLARIEDETKVRKWPGDPLTVVVAIGTNDNLFENGKQTVKAEELRQNIQEAISLIKPLADKMLFVGNTAVDEKLTTPVFWSEIHYTNEQMQKYEKIIQEIAQKNVIPFVPIFETFKNEMESDRELLADGLHPNNQGHQLIFDLVWPELDKLIRSKT